MKTRKFSAWSKTECDECSQEFQITRTEPREFKGDVICNDCEIYAKAFKEGADSISNEKQLGNAIRVKMLMVAFNDYQRTVSSIEAASNAHLIRINS